MSDLRQFMATPTIEECEERIAELEAENERLRKALAYWEDLGLDYEALEKDDE